MSIWGQQVRRRWVIGLLAAVGAMLLCSPSAWAFNPTEGSQYSGYLTSFVDPCPKDPSTHDYVCDVQHPTVTIDWGDGTPTTGGVTTLSGTCANGDAVCIYNVAGTHTYADAGTFQGTVDWSDGGSDASGALQIEADVADAPISLANGSITRSGQDATLTATLTDDNPDASPCSYTVGIQWGDGVANQTGLVQGCDIQIRHAHADGARDAASDDSAATATFTIGGIHTYAAGQPTSDEATLTVTDEGGSIATEQIPIPFPPETQTLAASLISFDSATLNASIDTSGGTLESCEFEWGTTTAYGNTAPCSSITQQQQTVSAPLTALAAATTYHYQVIVKTNVETVDGGDESFTTLASVAAGAPVVVTGAAGGITAAAATIGGTVDPRGFTLSDCHFEWGTTTAYGHTAACASTSPLSGSGAIPVDAALSGLSPDTVYHYRLVATNPNAPTSDGADAAFTTLPSCDVTATFGYVDATGCLSHTSAQYVSTPGSTLSINGLTLTPDYDFVTMTIDPSTGRISSSGPVTVSATGPGLGKVVVYNGQFSWTEPDPHDGNTVSIGTVTPPPLTKVAGIPLDGDFSLSFDKQDGADLSGNATLPFGPLSGTSLLDGTLVLHTVPGSGLVTNALQITSSGLELKGIGVKNLKVTYQPVNDTWSGGATIDLPTPNQLSIAASLAFQHGSFQEFSGSVDNINFPLWAGVELQRISVVFGVDPTVIGGGLGLSWGPQVAGKQLARIDGDFVYQAATSTAAGFIDVDGTLTLASFKVANAYFDYYTSELVAFGGGVQVGLPNPSAPDPSKQPVYFSAMLNGAIQGSAFDVDVNTTVALNFIDTTVGAEVLLSDKGLAACAKLSAFGFGWSPGFGYTWGSGNLDLMWTGCSVGPWETLNVGQAQPSAVVRDLHLPSGGALVALRGVGAQPKVTLHGPDGRRVSVPLNSVAPLKVPGFMVLQDPADHITWIAIQHSSGTWRVAPEAGGSVVASVRVAPLLPEPAVHGRVGGRGRRRTFTWSLRPIPGQRVVFWERGHDVGHIIGSTTAAHGTLHFTAGSGYSRRRTIQAQVYSYGHPRTVLTVTRYTAPPGPRPGKVGKLTVVAVQGGAVRVSWRPAPLAARYRIYVLTNGSHITELALGGKHSLVIRDVVPIKAATVTVTGELSDGVAGSGVRVKFSTPKPKPKKPTKPKKPKRK
jgi:hypothetical protein